MYATGGWCAPAATIYDFVDFVEPERWPAGLTAADLDWIARMLEGTEIDIPADHYFDLPLVAVRRGGIRRPTP